MKFNALEKRLLHRFTRHKHEAAQPALAPDGTTIAVVATDGERDELRLLGAGPTRGREVARADYVLDPCFCGAWLTWVEGPSPWRLRAVRWNDAAATPVTLPAGGRPRALAAANDGTDAWVAAETRAGRRTWIEIFALDRDRPPVRVTDGDANLYDPALALADGRLHVAYGAFLGGRYTVRLRSFDPVSGSLGAPIALTDRSDPCLWPSLHAAPDGGVWFSYTSFCVPRSDTLDLTQPVGYLRHDRYLAQQAFFNRRGLAHVGRWRDGGVEHPVGGPGYRDNQFFLASGMVFGTEGAGRTQVYVSPGGGAHLFHRWHSDSPAEVFAESDAPLRRHGQFKPRPGHVLHPALAVSTLAEGAWLPPKVLVHRAHLDAVPRLAPGPDGRVAVAFAEDARLTGWSDQGEWFDDTGEIGLGIVRVNLDAAPPEDWRIFLPSRSTGASLATPRPPEPATEGERRAVLGQTHCHSNLSICRREFDRDGHLNFRFMQDVQGARFGVLTDHEYNLWRVEMQHGRRLADYYDFPGEFAALHGYEWTGSHHGSCSHHGGPFGHMNVLSAEPLRPADIHNPNDEASPGCHPHGLWQALAGRDLITPPHHVVDAIHAYNWKFWDSRFEPVIEIYQDERGSGEQPGAPGVTNCLHSASPHWAVDALRGGKRFGFISGGDHTGIALAGLWVREVSRAGVLAALRSGQSYATTGVHAYVAWELVSAAAGAELRLRVTTVEPIREVVVLVNGRAARTLTPSPTGEWRWSEPALRPGDFLFCRVEWQNGELVWTSPQWLEALTSPETNR